MKSIICKLLQQFSSAKPKCRGKPMVDITVEGDVQV